MAANRDRCARATPPHDCQRFFRGTLLAKPGNERNDEHKGAEFGKPGQKCPRSYSVPDVLSDHATDFQVVPPVRSQQLTPVVRIMISPSLDQPDKVAASVPRDAGLKQVVLGRPCQRSAHFFCPGERTASKL